MKTINSLSGGKTSSYLAMNYPVDYNIFSLVCIDDEKCKPSDKNLIQKVNDKFEKYGFLEKYGEFVATAEDDKILKVMFDLEQMIGSEIVWVRHHSLDKWIDKKGMLMNMNMRYCTTETKIIPICEWVVNELMLKEDMQPVFMNQGIRLDEFERAKKGDNREYRNKIITGRSKTGNQNKWTEYFWAVGNYPLINDRISHYSIQEFWKDKSILFPEDSNCVGCFWKDVQQLRKNWDNQPNKMQWFSDQEKRKKHFFKPNIDYDQIKKIAIQQEFNFGTGSGCQAGFCTD
tara:strand:- start:58 stop:921 length:864 start_codon:yes stop_codon:yes gene_type:complete